MKEYRKVLQFFYKEKNYWMFLDKKNKHFFFKVDDQDNLVYVTIEELLELSCLFIDTPLIMNVKDSKKTKIIPKVIVGGIVVTLSSFVLSVAIEIHKSEERVNDFLEKRNNSIQIVSEDIKNYVSYDDGTLENIEVADGLVVDTYLESEWLNYIYIYDMDYLDKAIDYDSVTIEDVKEIIKNNKAISKKYKNLLNEYCDLLIAKYPDIELRVLYKNLQTLEVIECDKNDLVMKSLSMDSYGCYIRSENKIYVLENFDYVKGTWPYQVIFHEFSHCLRTGDWNIDDKRVKVQVEGQNFNNVITAEALNSLFTVSMFDYEEKDVAYQLQSNYHKVMIESMDNYSLEDYVKHSLSYYAKKLDEFNNDENYSTIILELINAQYNDYHDDSINISPSEYHPIYEYISAMYYKKHLSSDMSYSEAISVTDNLINEIMYDVPEDYNIDINYFYDYLNDYCKSIGIETNSKLRK